MHIVTSSNILTVNAGSSSIKFSLFEKETLTPVLKGAIERIGMEGTFVSIQNEIEGTSVRKNVTGEATQVLLDILTEHGFADSLSGIGHRIVHGGQSFHAPTLLTDEVIHTLEDIVAFAPQHLPVSLALIKKMREHIPHIPHVACFDTSFHHGMPRNAHTIPIPHTYREKGIRRYGFHGLSYEYLLGELKGTFNIPVAEKRIILAHLGNGASLAAVHNGVSVDTTMGFTPNSGIPMGTRTGDVDAGLFAYFINTVGMTVDDFNHMINNESGLLALSQTTADMETLLKEAPTHEHAEEAVSYFTYHVRKQIGALATSMGGLDVLVFSGGIGERSFEIRSRVSSELGFLGIELDRTANEKGDGRISKVESTVSVYCIPTNEEYIIAQYVRDELRDLS